MAVTLQTTVNTTVLTAGNAGIVMPVSLNKLGTLAAAVGVASTKPVGQLAAPVVDVQVTEVQLKPALCVSLIKALSAAYPPLLLKVSV